MFACHPPHPYRRAWAGLTCVGRCGCCACMASLQTGPRHILNSLGSGVRQPWYRLLGNIPNLALSNNVLLARGWTVLTRHTVSMVSSNILLPVFGSLCSWMALLLILLNWCKPWVEPFIWIGLQELVCGAEDSLSYRKFIPWGDEVGQEVPPQGPLHTKHYNWCAFNSGILVCQRLWQAEILCSWSTRVEHCMLWGDVFLKCRYSSFWAHIPERIGPLTRVPFDTALGLPRLDFEVCRQQGCLLHLCLPEALNTHELGCK